MKRRYVHTFIAIALCATALIWYHAQRRGRERYRPFDRARNDVSKSTPMRLKLPSHYFDTTSYITANGKEKRRVPDIVSLSTAAYRAQRFNVYFDPEEFVQDWLSRDEDLVKSISERLENAPELSNGLRPSFLEQQPSEALERMSCIDVLEQIASAGVTDESFGSASSALVEVIRRDLPETLNDIQKKMMVGEKYDALASLTRLKPDLAILAYISLIGTDKKNALKGAILAGLLNRGVKRGDVVDEFDALMAAAGG